MKNKGFTLVEFAVSFCLIATISLLILELIISMKTLYVTGNIKTTLLDKQAIMTKRIYDDYYNKYLRSVSSCGTNCYRFNYLTSDGVSETKDLNINVDESLITYDYYSIKLDNSNQIGDINVESFTYNLSNKSIDNSLLNIYIPIKNKLSDDNYGININFTYNSLTTTVNVS